MGVNFPTAFWKGSNPSDEEISIDWDLYLYYNTASNIGAGLVGSSSGPPFSQITSAHPYTVNDEDYYFNYSSLVNIKADNPDAFFGWLLEGYSQNNLEGYHRANPFIVENDGKELNLFFEADQSTVLDLSRENTYNGPDSASEKYYQDVFNHFISKWVRKGAFYAKFHFKFINYSFWLRREV